MKLKKIYSKYIPFKGYQAITILLWMVVRKEYKNSLPWWVECHETTHLKQEIEMLFIFFYIEYCIEYIVKFFTIFFIGLIHFKFDISFYRAYESLAVEQEAFEHQDELYYNEVRKHYAWIKYIFKLK